jgi:cytochrome P450
LYLPPRPKPLPAVVSLMRAALRGDGNLLDLLPGSAYRMDIGTLGWSRRSTFIVNRPDLVRHVLIEREDMFPKSDLMVHALKPLIGDSIFVSSGATWRRQREMVDPALSMMRINRAFPAMAAGVEDCATHLAQKAEQGEAFSLDLLMSHLTADIICRTVFSTQRLDEGAAHEVFEAFTVFERSVAQVEIKRLVLDKAWTEVPQKPEVLEACRFIRAQIGALLDESGQGCDDIARALAAVHDTQGVGFTREELIDQLGVLFLAGHETSASALTWVFFILASQPEIVARIREEVRNVCGDGPISFEQTKKLVFTRNVFRETVRLYPPITFLPRVAMEDSEIGGRFVKRGALVIVSPWVLHRHEKYWRDPDVFDPDRFLPEREGEMTPGAYIPFGTGPRICSGAAFASIEAVLIIARLVQSFDFSLAEDHPVRPAARLTTRPVKQVMCRVRQAGAP